jgi:Ca-activated chloride channel family protein
VKTHLKAVVATALVLLIAATLVVIAACGNTSGAYVESKRGQGPAPAAAAAGRGISAQASGPGYLSTTATPRPQPSALPAARMEGGQATRSADLSHRVGMHTEQQDFANAPEFDLLSILQENNITRDGDAARTPKGESAFGLPPDPNAELLIIERRKAEDNAKASALAADTALGAGGLLCEVDGKQVIVPLKHTDVKGSVAGYISAVNVTQQFHNPYDSKIEAVYVFPLPENAAVSEFLMTIGDRTIRGIIRERADAERIYNQARAQGYTASLLTQERPNIFTQKVANIEPGKAIDINITYYSTLTYSDGGYEFVFPMVVGPRFNPTSGGAGFQPAGDGIGAVAQGHHGASNQKTEVQYHRPEDRTGHDIALTLDIDAGVSIEALECRTHKADIQRTGPSRATVTLSKNDRIPNRDFVLRWQVAGDSVKSAILAHEDDRGGYFTMMLVPPKDLKRVPRNAVELVFVLDRSGSMSGRPMEQAQNAIARGLERLQPGDSFQIIDFSNDASALGSAPIEATGANVYKGKNYLASLSAGGGTYMMKGLKASLGFPHDAERLRFVVFCTDGYIGNEAEILGALHQGLGSSRVFSFGVGTAVNRYLMDSMARMGNGIATYLNLTDDPATVMDTFFDRVSHAPLSDVKIDWAGAQVSEVFPSRVPDLFADRPVIITGRFKGDLPPSVRVSGRMGAERRELPVSVTRADDAVATKALAQVWARAKLTDIADQSAWDVHNLAELAQAAKKTALDYALMSDFTAFVAVDSSVRTAGEFGTTVHVPVPVPPGVRYDTTVTEK